MKLIISFLLCLMVLCSAGQQVGIGQWQDHLPYHQGQMVAVGGGNAYASTPNTIIAYSREDNSIERLSKVNALSNLAVSAINYHQETSQLIVGYSNGAIDLVTSSGVQNLADIERSALIGDKTIYQVVFDSGLAYMTTGFGIVVIDLVRKEVKDTYYLGEDGAQVKVNDLAFYSNRIFAATDIGLFAAPASGANLADFSSWERDTIFPGGNGPFNAIAAFEGNLFLNKKSEVYNSDTLYQFDGSSWTIYQPFLGLAQHSLVVSEQNLVVTQNGVVVALDKELNESGRIFTYVFGKSDPRYAVLDEQGKFWIADRNHGLVTGNDSYTNERILPDGPQSNSSFKLTSFEGKIAVATGGVFASSYNNQFKTEGFYLLENGSWDHVSKQKDAVLDTVFDYMDVAIDPLNPTHVVAGTWGGGLVSSVAGRVNAVYNHQNSTFLEAQSRPDFVAVPAVAYDALGNLWASNAYSGSPLQLYSSSGEWIPVGLGGTVTTSDIISEIMVDSRGYLWASVLTSGGAISGKGLLVYNTAGTPEDLSDDEYKLLTTAVGNGALPESQVYAIAEDDEGEIWLGTSKGIAVIYRPENIFDGSAFDAQQILIDQDGVTQVLLEAENVTTIAVDGANQKWMGTSNSGVFLMSEDGTQENFAFNESNSPLFSNTINDIAINSETGEVFIATAEGLVSFRGYATDGVSRIGEVSVFPNPVRPEYTGLIGIKGLASNSQVRITDVAGNLVYETESFGGQAVWNGNDMYGKRASTGVYLVFSSTSNGDLTTVAKILFVN